jgi:Zn-dependent protease with chaperone function
MDKNINKLVTTKEKVLFFIVSCLSLVVLFSLFLLACICIYKQSIHFFELIVIIIVSRVVANGLFVGYLRQNSVRVSKTQFADICEILEDYSKKLNLKNIPKFYIMQSGGSLNAFATRFLCKDIVAIYSDILELAYTKGEDAVKFIVAHELAHVKRKHMSKRIITHLGYR